MQLRLREPEEPMVRKINANSGRAADMLLGGIEFSFVGEDP